MDRALEADIKAHLMETSEEFRQLSHQHLELKHQVEEMEAKSILTEQEEVEEHKLKKLKLHLKDVMEQMVLDHASHQVA